MFWIRKSSAEVNEALEPRWHYPSALSPEAHAEWGLYKILEYMGLHEIGSDFGKTLKNTTSPMTSTLTIQS